MTWIKRSKGIKPSIALVSLWHLCAMTTKNHLLMHPTSYHLLSESSASDLKTDAESQFLKVMTMQTFRVIPTCVPESSQPLKYFCWSAWLIYTPIFIPLYDNQHEILNKTIFHPERFIMFYVHYLLKLSNVQLTTSFSWW